MTDALQDIKEIDTTPYKIDDDSTIDSLAAELRIPTHLVPNFEHAIDEFVEENKPDWAQIKDGGFIFKTGEEISVEDMGGIMRAFQDLKLDADILTTQEKIFRNEAQQYLLDEGYTNIEFLTMEAWHWHEDKLHGQNPPKAKLTATDFCEPAGTPNYNNAYTVYFYAANSKKEEEYQEFAGVVREPGGENRLLVLVTIKDGKIESAKLSVSTGRSF